MTHITSLASTNTVTAVPCRVACAALLDAFVLTGDFRLRSVQKWGLRYNRLSGLPGCIGEMQSLRDIWLRGNTIATLPPSFCQLDKLDSVYIMESGLTSLPDCFGRVGRAWTDVYVPAQRRTGDVHPASLSRGVI